MSKSLEVFGCVAGRMLALVLIIPVWLALLCGRIQVTGLTEARESVRRGRVVLLANHPALIEAVVLASFFWHWHWLRRGGRVPWTLTDQGLFFGRLGRWLYPGLQALPVVRLRTNMAAKRRVLEEVQRLLSSGGSLMVFPESGRTCKGNVFVSKDGRRVRSCDASVLRIASRTAQDVSVLPIWIEHGVTEKPESMLYGYWKLFFGPRLTIMFGSAVSIKNSDVSSVGVAQLLLSVPTSKG